MIILFQTKMVITPTANRLPPARYPPQPVRNGGPASSQPSASVHISVSSTMQLFYLLRNFSMRLVLETFLFMQEFGHIKKQ